MDELGRNILLALCGFGALVALVVAYMWYFVFGRSLRGVLMAGLSILLNRDSRIDLNDDVELVKRPQDVKNEMAQEIDSLDFQGQLSSHDEYIPHVSGAESDTFGAQAVETASEQDELVSSSFGGGRFHRVRDAFTRPFLRMRMSLSNNHIPAQNVKYGADSTDNETTS